MMGLPDGQKRFKIGIAVLTQYRHVMDGQMEWQTDRQTDRHRIDTPRYAERRVGKQ